MLFVSDFADQALMLPLATVVMVVLGLTGWWRGAAAWMAAVGGTFVAVLVLKAGLFALSESYGSEYLMSPSGHVASAIVVYGGVTVALFQGMVPGLVMAIVPAAAAAIVGYSRVALMAHSVGEVLAGGLIGTAGLAIFVMTLGPRPRLSVWPLATACACTVLALHGSHLPAEEAIRSASSGW